MKRYVLANIKIPIVINENGLFDMLNEYTQTEITSLNELPEIEEEDNLYKKIMEFLEKPRQDLGQDLGQDSGQDLGQNLGQDSGQNLGQDSGQNFSQESESDNLEEESTKSIKELTQTKDQILTICKNNIKMRKHSDNMSFKNIKKGSNSYTRKIYTKSI